MPRPLLKLSLLAFVQDVIAAYNTDAFKDYAFKRFAIKRFEGYKHPESWNH